MAFEDVTISLLLPVDWGSSQASTALDREALTEMARRGLSTITNQKSSGGTADDRTPGVMTWTAIYGMG